MNNTNTTHIRAAKGGQFGANGEWYEGGKFINTVPENSKRHKVARKGAGKVEIAPYVWEVAPEGKASLFQTFKSLVNMQTGEVNTQACHYYGKNPAVLAQNYGKWVAGERWI